MLGLGSFTGIRIGVSTIKAFAEVNSKKIIPVSSLDGLTYNVKLLSEYICSIIDCKNNNVYLGLYDNNHNLINNYLACDINEAIKIIPQKSICFVGTGAILYKDILQNNFNANFFLEENFSLSAENIGKASLKKINKNSFILADDLKPLYLKPSQAERMLKTK